MSKFLSPALLLAFNFLVACGDANKPDGEQPVDLSKQEFTGVTLDERLPAADSLVVVFYKDPYGEDSLRYTRYYTQVPVTHDSAIAVLLRNLEGRFLYEPERRKCRGEGKIWVYREKQVFQTLYFSSAEGECHYLYLLKNGNFYYTRLNQSLEQQLKQWKLESKEPANQGKDAE